MLQRHSTQSLLHCLSTSAPTLAPAPASGPLARYREMVLAGSVSEDAQQLHTLRSFQRLHDQLAVYTPERIHPTPAPLKKKESTGFWGSLFGSSPAAPRPSIGDPNAKNAGSAAPNGIYLYGGVGCGKTFMMDMFYDSLPSSHKKRVHFDDFMIDTHKRLHQLKKKNDQSEFILDTLTTELINSAHVLCFDEFQVTDIADAMLLKNMFTLLFNKGVVVVATSNRGPTELYKDGLQRDLFLPFCHLLERKSEVLFMKETIDYRMIKHETQEKKVCQCLVLL
jgi:protein AFG1